jgi:hypothetical protein
VLIGKQNSAKASLVAEVPAAAEATPEQPGSIAAEAAEEEKPLEPEAVTPPAEMPAEAPAPPAEAPAPPAEAPAPPAEAPVPPAEAPAPAPAEAPAPEKP